MTRWHKPSCRSPDVVVDGGNRLRCQSCESECPELEGLLKLAQSTSPSPNLGIPRDEIAGHLNLQWPSSVPYTGDQAGSHDVGKLSVKAATTSPEIYTRTLKTDEFRLVCLSAVSQDDRPIHLELETYSHDVRPEYETVSYTWGGEDNDYSLSCPIYIGPYWDVLLQTKNCQALLKFVAPWRGMRMLWVDAICIDQSNVGEREAQVAKMEQIYDESSKVLVYLGPDIVSKTQRFPTYKTLYDLADASSILSPFPRVHPLHDNPPDLHQLLGRKYFSRIWVVQELILSEKIVFTVGDTEYRADPRVMSKLNSFAWEKTAAPWVRHIASKSFPKERVKGFDSLIKLTANCKASDPRDLLFGTRGLLDNDTEKDSFPTNYSLSFQQFYIGLHAHWLLNVKDWSVLLTAGILAKASTSSTPSWVPDISTPDLWPMKFAGHLREHDLLLSLEDIERSRDNAKKTFYRINMPRSRGDEPLLTPLNGLIQHDTGALSLTAIFVLRFERVPRLVGHFGKTNIYCLDSQDADASVDMTGLRLLLLSTLPLHDIVTLRLDHLYMSDSSATWNDKYGYHFMILRANTTDGRPNNYQLVSSDVFMMEGSLYNLEQAASSSPEHDTKAIHLTASWIRKSVAELISDICTVRQYIRLHTSSEVHSIYKQHAPACWLRPPWHQIFPWIADEDVLRNVFATLSKYLCVNREQWNRIDGEDRFFRDAYLACVSSRKEQEVNDDKLIIKFDREQWTRCGGLYIPLDFDHWSMTLTNFKARQPFYRQFFDRGRGGYRARGYGGRFPNYLNPLEAHQVELDKIRAHYAQLTWQWKWETSDTWQPCARNSQPRLEDFSEDNPRLWVTTPILGVARFLRKELDFTVRMLSSLRNSYSLDVGIDSVIEMINLGPQKEQEEIIAAKDIGGVRIEGQQRRITLI